MLKQLEIKKIGSGISIRLCFAELFKNARAFLHCFVLIYLIFFLLSAFANKSNADNNIGHITNIKGSVEISFIDGIWLPCRDNANVNIGVSIRTAEKSAASLILKNGKTINISENTILKAADIIKTEYTVPEIANQSYSAQDGASEKKVKYQASLKNIIPDKTTVYVVIYNELGVVFGEYRMNLVTADNNKFTAEYTADVSITETGRYSHRYKIVCAE